MNINKLKGLIVEREMSVDTLADATGIGRASLYRKINNPEKFTIGDAMKIKEALRMSDDVANEIFLA